MVLNKIKFKKKISYRLVYFFRNSPSFFNILLETRKNLKQNENENLVLKENSSSIDPNKNFLRTLSIKVSTKMEINL